MEGTVTAGPIEAMLRAVGRAEAAVTGVVVMEEAAGTEEAVSGTAERAAVAVSGPCQGGESSCSIKRWGRSGSGYGCGREWGMGGSSAFRGGGGGDVKGSCNDGDKRGGAASATAAAVAAAGA